MIHRNSTLAQRDRQRIRATKAACGICGQPIDYTITDRENPRVFVVDHIVPLHKGGLDHISNKQATHRECNSKKRARLVAPIVRRSGSLT